jgi:hypothetical protein
VANASRIVTVDLIDEINVTADPILAMTIGTDVITAATTAMMTDATTTVVTITLISMTEVTVMMIATMTVPMTGATIDVVRMTTTAKKTTARSGHLRHLPREATLLVVAKRSKPTDKLDQMPERSGTSTPKIHDLYGGLSSQSLSPGKIIGFTAPTPEPIRWSLIP